MLKTKLGYDLTKTSATAGGTTTNTNTEPHGNKVAPA